MKVQLLWQLANTETLKGKRDRTSSLLSMGPCPPNGLRFSREVAQKRRGSARRVRGPLSAASSCEPGDLARPATV